VRYAAEPSTRVSGRGSDVTALESKLLRRSPTVESRPAFSISDGNRKQRLISSSSVQRTPAASSRPLRAGDDHAESRGKNRLGGEEGRTLLVSAREMGRSPHVPSSASPRRAALRSQPLRQRIEGPHHSLADQEFSRLRWAKSRPATPAPEHSAKRLRGPRRTAGAPAGHLKSMIHRRDSLPGCQADGAKPAPGVCTRRLR